MRSFLRNRWNPPSSHQKSHRKSLGRVPNLPSNNFSHLSSNHSPCLESARLSEGRSQTTIFLRPSHICAPASAANVLGPNFPRRKEGQTRSRERRKQTRIFSWTSRTSTRTTNLHHPIYPRGSGGDAGILRGNSSLLLASRKPSDFRRSYLFFELAWPARKYTTDGGDGHDLACLIPMFLMLIIT